MHWFDFNCICMFKRLLWSGNLTVCTQFCLFLMSKCICFMSFSDIILSVLKLNNVDLLRCGFTRLCVPLIFICTCKWALNLHDLQCFRQWKKTVCFNIFNVVIVMNLLVFLQNRSPRRWPHILRPIFVVFQWPHLYSHSLCLSTAAVVN